MTGFYRFVITILKILMPFVFRVKAEGLENIPKEGPAIVCANHRNMLDCVVIAIKCKRQIYFLGKQELYKTKFWRTVFLKLGSIPVKRGEPDLNVIRQSGKVLKEGHLLGIFPEGTRIKTGELGEFEPGTAMIALRNKSSVVPMHIYGDYKFMHRIVLKVGKPFELTEYYGQRMSMDLLAEATEVIKNKVKEV
jgi:1-acyl-sn-glycerol-3-phosphate acyltransferase